MLFFALTLLAEVFSGPAVRSLTQVKNCHLLWLWFSTKSVAAYGALPIDNCTAWHGANQVYVAGSSHVLHKSWTPAINAGQRTFSVSLTIAVTLEVYGSDFSCHQVHGKGSKGLDSITTCHVGNDHQVEHKIPSRGFNPSHSFQSPVAFPTDHCCQATL